MAPAREPGPPIGQYVLKMHGRCDLACDHCYVFEAADQSWRGKPRSMLPHVVEASARRIAEHAAARGLSRVRVVLHGGEPLLVGAGPMRDALDTLRSAIEPVARLDLVMQTNGVQLDVAMCEVLKEYGVRVGVSLDGYREAHDRHRRYASGAGSFEQVRAALRLLRTPAYRELYAGLLCTIDLANDPVEVYRALLAEQPPRIDFLLPHATWANPPARPGGDPTPYATWLSTIHRHWLADARPTRVRMFEALESTGRGGPSGSEQIGADAVDLVVIETDGFYEQADTIKTAFDGAPRTGLDVFRHRVDEVAALAPVAARQSGIDGLSAICRNCPVVTQCGGGLYAHRWRPGAGFDNPSVYCADLRVLVDRTNEELRMHAEGKPDDIGAMLTTLIGQIGSGFGDAESIGWLAEQELTITRALLVAIVDQHGASAAWELLASVETHSPDAVRQTLSHPYVRQWAVERLQGGTVCRLGSLAAAAAVRAGLPVEVDAEAVEGVVHLPGAGTAYLPSGTSGPARLKFDGAALYVTAAGDAIEADLSRAAPTGVWQPARRVTFPDGWSILIEDGDPLRACHRWPVAGRLSDDEDRAWRSALTGAWRLIRDETPAYVPAIRGALRTVVPLQPAGDGTQRASTARHAFGSVAAALPGPADLAVLLVHEFQHGKLGALLDLCDLFDVHSEATVKVAWRPDPRPVEGVLQGVYAHAAVADVHRMRAARDPGAVQVFEKYHRWTVDAIAGLRATGGLTPLGENFLDRVEAGVRSWSL